MYKLTNPPSVRKVTPKEVDEDFLPYNTFPGQRDLSGLKVRRYADGMEEGSMRPVDIAIATGPNGAKFLMNGQHVCHGIKIFGKPYNAIVSYYKCETEEDLWKLFATFDVH